ncbi:SusC/RagA family TonB-linked outer membrane protein [Hymenobacter busanensis]|uniref:SusC/RagA family TonB-linked outer membrane protein n=1 Tax=Hymenobacter busanensis TaxID=2607656 RepID=A0A7L4ZS37_9BACT|nr:SusC/RagA family TonB-linked outer membrane protein [Hymenobacter busanensis]KAA9327165.1 SusC/RagA family TonB-linked outer membrane protein [Hymenobacter busanensis]QHJ05831.1 SusC/RagA family TonB-linked outer membrane protein [Hymenobacter busanensis]
MKRTILLSLALPLLLVGQAAAQSRAVTGKVTDRQTGQGLPGVTVLLKGTTNGASTNADGIFSLSVPAEGGTLVFSSIGYSSVEQAIGNQATIDVTLATDTRQLSEVVVTALGIERERKSLGYAVETLENKDITRASEQNLVRSLQGRVAGVQISSASGAAGGATRIVIRGAQSFTGDNQPIYVVDGNVISNNAATNLSTATPRGNGDDLNNGVDLPNRAADIDPNNVESITVLKGPAAAALYGARAASGAIIITTKKGAGLKGRSQITVNSAVTLDRVNRLPKFQNTYGSGTDGVYDPQNNVSWGPRMDGRLVPDWRTYTLADPNATQVDSIPLTPKPDNVRDFFQTGVTTNNSISFAGSNQASNFYVSLADVRTKSFIPNTNYKRTSVSLNGGTQLFSKVTTNATLTYVKSGGDRGVQGQSRSNILQTILNTPRDISLTEQKNYNDPRYDLNGYYLAGFRNNPYFLLDRNLLTDDVDRLLGTASVSYDPLEWLNLTFRQGVDVYTDRRRQTISQGTINNLAGRYLEDNNFGRNLTTDALINVTRRFAEDFTIKGVFGTNYQEQLTSRAVADGVGLVIPDFYDVSNASVVTNTKVDTKQRILGVFADLQLAYRDYLYLGLTGRNDWTSTLPKATRSFFYPSANVGFIFTEAFKLENNLLSFGKVRANIASVGKPPIPYQIDPVFVRSTVDNGFQAQYVFPLQSVAGFRVGNVLGNPGLKSELTTAYEGGLEMRFLQNRLGFDATYYRSISKDIIVNVPVPGTSGFTAQTANAGTMENRGIELALNATPVRLENSLTWDLNFTFTHNRNRVTEVTNVTPNIGVGGLGSVALEARVGQPYGSFFGTQMLRDGEGRVVIDPVSGFPRLDPVLTTLGNIQPKYLAGASTTVSFKGLALNVLFDTKQGGKFFSNTINQLYFAGALRETTANDRQPFLYPNSVIPNPDGSGTFVPNTTVLTDGGFNYWRQVSTAGENTLFDASYVKFREASLSYSLPTELVSKVKLTGIQVSLIGRNLALWTPKSQPHLDPEVSSLGSGNNQGFEFYAYPTTRSLGASLRLTL